MNWMNKIKIIFDKERINGKIREGAFRIRFEKREVGRIRLKEGDQVCLMTWVGEGDWYAID